MRKSKNGRYEIPYIQKKRILYITYLQKASKFIYIDKNNGTWDDKQFCLS